MKKIVWEIRASLCELLIEWALKVQPDDYVSSITQAVLNERSGKRTLSK